MCGFPPLLLSFEGLSLEDRGKVTGKKEVLRGTKFTSVHWVAECTKFALKNYLTDEEYQKIMATVDTDRPFTHLRNMTEYKPCMDIAPNERVASVCKQRESVDYCTNHSLVPANIYTEIVNTYIRFTGLSHDELLNSIVTHQISSKHDLYDHHVSTVLLLIQTKILLELKLLFRAADIHSNLILVLRGNNTRPLLDHNSIDHDNFDKALKIVKKHYRKQWDKDTMLMASSPYLDEYLRDTRRQKFWHRLMSVHNRLNLESGGGTWATCRRCAYASAACSTRTAKSRNRLRGPGRLEA